MTRGEAALARARAALGTSFRLHGRSPVTGLDCVGLVAWAHRLVVPNGYSLRSTDVARVQQALVAFGFAAGAGACPGDVLLLAPGPGQLHLAIRSTDGMVHADGILRRVVERPGTLPWPVLGSWRR
jgi:murein DD-endopeptidase / murein LD-carboxypeptidase